MTTEPLRLLEQLLPARASEPAPAVDWAAAEDELGTELPADYRAFADRWGRVKIDGALSIEVPSGDSSTGLVGLVRWKCAVDRDSIDEGSWTGAVWPEPGGLLPFGWTEDGTTLLWRTGGDEWKVVERRDDEYAGDFGSETDTGLAFADWLTQRIGPASPEKVEFVDGDERPVWVPHGRPELADMGVEALNDGWEISLNVGDVLGVDRTAALDGLLEFLAAGNPKARAAIVSSQARHSRELIVVEGGWRGRRRAEQIRDGAMEYCRREVEH